MRDGMCTEVLSNAVRVNVHCHGIISSGTDHVRDFPPLGVPLLSSGRKISDHLPTERRENERRCAVLLTIDGVRFRPYSYSFMFCDGIYFIGWLYLPLRMLTLDAASSVLSPCLPYRMYSWKRLSTIFLGTKSVRRTWYWYYFLSRLH